MTNPDPVHIMPTIPAMDPMHLIVELILGSLMLDGQTQREKLPQHGSTKMHSGISMALLLKQVSKHMLCPNLMHMTNHTAILRGLKLMVKTLLLVVEHLNCVHMTMVYSSHIDLLSTMPHLDCKISIQKWNLNSGQLVRHLGCAVRWARAGCSY